MNRIGPGPRCDALIVLIPSPLLGPYSWSLVRDELAERGWEALVSVDSHDPVGRQPCWRRTVGCVEATLHAPYLSALRHLAAGHFQQLVDPAAVAAALIGLLADCSIRSHRSGDAAALKGATP